MWGAQSNACRQKEAKIWSVLNVSRPLCRSHIHKDFDSCKTGALSLLGRGLHVTPEPSPAEAYQCCGDLCCGECCCCGEASFPGVYLGALPALLVASTTIASAKLSSLGWTTWMNFLGVLCI